MLKGLDYKGITYVRAINAESHLSVKLTRKGKIYVCISFTHHGSRMYNLKISLSLLAKLR